MLIALHITPIVHQNAQIGLVILGIINQVVIVTKAAVVVAVVVLQVVLVTMIL